MFKMLFRWKKIKKAVEELREAYTCLNEFLYLAQDVIKDKELLEKLRKVKMEVLEAKNELRGLLK